MKNVHHPEKRLSMLKLNKNEKKAIVKAASFLKNNYPVENVILFGSKARGDDEEGSDIDLLLLTSRPMHWRERERLISDLFDIEMAFDVVISILDTTTAEWEDGPFSFFPIYDHICQEGVIAS